jgi:hypothetical protein
MCASTCPLPPFTISGDYEANGFDDITLAGLCCLEYGVPRASVRACLMPD